MPNNPPGASPLMTPEKYELIQTKLALVLSLVAQSQEPDQPTAARVSAKQESIRQLARLSTLIEN